MKDLLTNGIYLNGLMVLWILMVVSLIVIWLGQDYFLYRKDKEERDAELIHKGWLNHEEWTSDQIRKYRQETHDWNGVPMELKKSERGEYLWTIPFVSENPDEEK